MYISGENESIRPREKKESKPIDNTYKHQGINTGDLQVQKNKSDRYGFMFGDSFEFKRYIFCK